MTDECEHIESDKCTTLNTMEYAKAISEDGSPFAQISENVRMAPHYATTIGEIGVKKCLCRTPEHVKCPTYLKLEGK